VQRVEELDTLGRPLRERGLSAYYTKSPGGLSRRGICWYTG